MGMLKVTEKCGCKKGGKNNGIYGWMDIDRQMEYREIDGQID